MNYDCVIKIIYTEDGDERVSNYFICNASDVHTAIKLASKRFKLFKPYGIIKRFEIDNDWGELIDGKQE